MVEVFSVLADAVLGGRPNLHYIRDMPRYLHYTQTISVMCRQTTRAVIIYTMTEDFVFDFRCGVWGLIASPNLGVTPEN